MEDDVNCELVSWKYINTLSKTVAKNIRSVGFQPDFIIGLARGGFVPSRTLADLLGVKDLVSIKVSHWGVTATKDGKAELKYPIKIDLTGKKVLVVDDITDTGESMILAKDYIQSLGPVEIKTATLMHITHSKFVPDFYAEEVDKTDWKWFIFPWCFVEDVSSFVVKIVESEGESDLSSIKKEIEKRFKIKVEQEKLLEVMEEMEYRDIVEKIGDNIWKKKS
jgi:hypoxanthine phosphoribosyltransferase